MFEIHTWRDVFLALHQTALDARGSIELHPGSDVAVRWPRTIGADVLAIAAVLDPVVRAHRHGPDGHGIGRRWGAVTAEIARSALRSLRSTYRDNRAFWSVLPSLCVYLDAERAALPAPATLEGLLAQLGEDLDPRNAGPAGDGPFQRFEGVRTFDDLFVAQRAYLRDLRGGDLLDPEPGMTGGRALVPRTTNADVIALADYWTRQLGRVKRVMGAERVAERWQAALADVDAIARPGDPSALYAQNHAFWRALQATAIHVAVADEAPSRTDLMIDALTTSLANLPDNVAAGAKALAAGAAEVAGDVAHGLGRAVNEAGKGLFGGLGTPLVVGAGLVGLYVLARGHRGEEAKA